MPCAYHKPKKCEHLRYCHLELILLIILFLGGMFPQTSSIFLRKIIAHFFGIGLSKNSWCSFTQIYFSIS
jgi:hypothetical protein